MGCILHTGTYVMKKAFLTQLLFYFTLYSPEYASVNSVVLGRCFAVCSVYPNEGPSKVSIDSLQISFSF